MSAFYDQGLHAAEITGQALGESSKGTPQFILKVKIMGNGTPSQYTAHAQQYERTVYMTLTEKTMKFVAEKLASIGFTGKGLSYLDPNKQGYHNFVGQEVALWCKHEPAFDNPSEMREKWDIARQDGASRPIDAKPADSKKMRDLDNLFAAATKGTVKPAAPKPAGAAAEITDQDLPF